MEQSMLSLEGEVATYQNSPRQYPIGVFTETMTLGLSNWQHSITLLSSSSTRKAVMGRYMIPSPFQGNTKMSWLVFMTVVNQRLWRLEFFFEETYAKKYQTFHWCNIVTRAAMPRQLKDCNSWKWYWTNIEKFKRNICLRKIIIVTDSLVVLFQNKHCCKSPCIH